MATAGPKRIDINPLGFWGHVSGGGTLSRFQSSTNLAGGTLNQGTVAQNDEIGWNVLLDAGTWTFTMLHWAQNNMGIYTVKLDSTTLGTIDGYSAGSVANTVGTISGIAVATSAIYTLKLVMATKNASSTNYYYSPHWIALNKTA